jgi:thiol-disulfide isomerase/thioredoxin
MPAYEVVASTFHQKDVVNQSNIIIARIDIDQHRHFVKRFNLIGFPTIKYFQAYPSESEIPIAEKGTTYKGDASATSIIQYVNERAGTSYSMPQRSTWVRSLVPKIFEAVALDPTRHVLVQFHAPWCVECKAFTVVWETVGRTYRSDDQIVVLASVDASKYRQLGQQQDVTSYPTIKYYPGYGGGGGGGDGDGDDDADVSIRVASPSNGKMELPPEDVSGSFSRTYNGGMTAQDLVNFINEVAGLDRIVGGDIHRKAGRSKKLDDSAQMFITALRSGRKLDAEKVLKDVVVETSKLCGSEIDHSEVGIGEIFESEVDDAEIGGRGGSRLGHVNKLGTTKHIRSLSCSGALLFERTCKKILGHVNGISWAHSERARLETLIQDDDVNHVQRTHMMLRRNVLDAFLV